MRSTATKDIKDSIFVVLSINKVSFINGFFNSCSTISTCLSIVNFSSISIIDVVSFVNLLRDIDIK